ncbi:MAG: hypothetical protein E7436_08145 [Ruminococcaceae bacterium]|nr:hypothetical protein [Oscillospiraceae bacterium]
MYEIGQLVVYGVHGVCQIVERQTRTVDRKKAEYLVLEPAGQRGSTFLVPVGNPNALAKLRPVLKKAEVDALLLSDRIREHYWIPEENARKQYYRELLAGGDRVALLQMICSLERHKQEQAARGKKFHQCDEIFMRDAMRLIDGEFSIALGIPQSEVGPYIRTKCE